MIRRRGLALAAAAALGIGAVSIAAPPPARALNVIKPVCTVAGLINQLASKACSLLGGGGGVASTATTALTLAAVVAWAVGGAKFVLHQTGHVLAATTSPQLTSTWFSSTYWRVAAIAAVLTLPFLFAAAVQALVRSDLTLLLRAALGYLPLALLAVAIAAPLTMLLLAASDQLSAIVTSAAGNQSGRFLARSGALLTAVTGFIASPFVVLLVGLLTVAGALVLWMELLVREAAVYVVVLMLPLAFAAFVWPARRMWAIRSVELLVALILSKFAIVAVLALGGAALDQSITRSVTGLLAGAVLLALATFAPWALLRLIPLAEIASSATASIHEGSQAARSRLVQSDEAAARVDDWGTETAQMRRWAEDVAGANDAVTRDRPATVGLAEDHPAGSAPTPGEQAVGARDTLNEHPGLDWAAGAASNGSLAPSGQPVMSVTSDPSATDAAPPVRANGASARAPAALGFPAAADGEPRSSGTRQSDWGGWQRPPFDLEPPAGQPMAPEPPGHTADDHDATPPSQPSEPQDA